MVPAIDDVDKVLFQMCQHLDDAIKQISVSNWSFICSCTSTYLQDRRYATLWWLLEAQTVRLGKSAMSRNFRSWTDIMTANDVSTRWYNVLLLENDSELVSSQCWWRRWKLECTARLSKWMVWFPFQCILHTHKRCHWYSSIKCHSFLFHAVTTKQLWICGPVFKFHCGQIVKFLAYDNDLKRNRRACSWMIPLQGSCYALMCWHVSRPEKFGEVDVSGSLTLRASVKS